MDESKIEQFNELLVSISTNMMLHEMGSAKKEFLLKNLSFQELHTIELIGKLEHPTMGQLARAAKVTQGTISIMVKKLVEKGLVERTGSPEDLRVVKARLTEKGCEAYRQHQEMHRKATREWLSLVSEDESEIILTVLKKINRFLSR
ncbi:MAG: MarR family transcriptional regulator [bacterium]